MEKIKQFDKQNLKELRIKIQTALDGVFKETGVKVSLGNISFQENSFTTKLSAVIGNGEGNNDDSFTVTKAKADFDNYAVMFGLKKEDLGKIINVNGSDYEIAGIMPRRKNPVLCKNVKTGKLIIVDVDAVKYKLEKAKA